MGQFICFQSSMEGFMKLLFNTSKIQTPPFVQAKEQTGKMVQAYEDKQSKMKQGLDIPVQQIIQKLQKTTNVLSRQVQFRVDKSSKTVVVTILDSETNEIIRQIPSPEILRMIHEIDKIIGRFIDYKG